MQPQMQRKQSMEANQQILLQAATEAFVRELGLDDDSMIDGHLEYKELAPGAYLDKDNYNLVSVYIIIIIPCVKKILRFRSL